MDSNTDEKCRNDALEMEGEENEGQEYDWSQGAGEKMFIRIRRSFLRFYKDDMIPYATAATTTTIRAIRAGLSPPEGLAEAASLVAEGAGVRRLLVAPAV